MSEIQRPHRHCWAGKDICGALFQRGWKYHDTGMISIAGPFGSRIPGEVIGDAGGPREADQLIAGATPLSQAETMLIKRDLERDEKQLKEYHKHRELTELKEHLAHACKRAASIPGLVEKIRRVENGLEEGVCPHCGANLSIEDHETDQCSECKKELGQETGRNPLK